ncbi:hypothetical protein HBH99_256320 [Parastagonospora nodorum]|nr:hypothetical protein HBH99_256320 [Parastagonospora nodorum]
MMTEKRQLDQSHDDVLQAAISQLDKLTFTATRAFEPDQFLSLVQPGDVVRGTTAEEKARRAVLETEDRDSEAENVAKKKSKGEREKASEVIDERPEPENDENLIPLDDGDFIHVGTYLGDEWESAITRLDRIPPVKIKGMKYQPHPWQAKGAAQGHYLCEHKDFKVFYCGDEMGLGKTLLAIMMAKLVQSKPGFCVVVAPKTICGQWLKEIAGAFHKVLRG